MVALTDVISEDAIRTALRKRAPKGTEDHNMKALSIGIDYVRDLMEKGVTA
jgi:Pyruvate/2-oxoacid:ferredoxin oxidoreductase gamma subunit